jgi:hypothetical protein
LRLLKPWTTDPPFSSPQINEFNGSRTVQLKVLDWRPA